VIFSSLNNRSPNNPATSIITPTTIISAFSIITSSIPLFRSTIISTSSKALYVNIYVRFLVLSSALNTWVVKLGVIALVSTIDINNLIGLISLISLILIILNKGVLNIIRENCLEEGPLLLFFRELSSRDSLFMPLILLLLVIPSSLSLISYFS
jgi:hypothetical protein